MKMLFNLYQKTYYLLLLIIFQVITNVHSFADSCPTSPTCTYTASAGASYTVKSGDAICINSGTNYNSGTIYLNGGTIYVASGGTLNFANILPYAANTNINISAATNASPIAITTSSNHNYITGQRVTIASVGGNTAANATWTVTVTGANSFTLDGSSGNGTYTSGGTATLIPSFTVSGATNASPVVITTSATHGFVTGQTVGIQGVVGNESANGTWTITRLSATTFSLDNSVGSGTWSSGGTAQLLGTITNCGTLAGTPNNSTSWGGLTINNYSTSALSYDPNGHGGLINNYANVTLSLSNFYGGSKLTNGSGNTITTSNTNFGSTGGTVIENRGTINFTGNFYLTTGTASNHSKLTNYSGGTINFQATSSSSFLLNGYTDLINSGTVNLSATSGNTAITLNSNSTLTNNYGGTITATNGDILGTGGTLYNKGTLTARNYNINSSSFTTNLYDNSVLNVTNAISVNANNTFNYLGASTSCAYVNYSGSAPNFWGSFTTATNIKYCGATANQNNIFSTLTITGATNATPIVITTSASHGLVSGNLVYITGVNGNTAANGNFIITKISSTTFSLATTSNVAVAGNGAWTSGGTVNLTNMGSVLYVGTGSCTAPTCSAPLPIELASFTVEAKHTCVEVSWTSSVEINNNYYSVERSDDGLQFNEIAQVKGAGNSIHPIHYIYTDSDPLLGVSYYKLKQTDFDGKYEYFDIKSVNFNEFEDKWIIFPNPSDGNKLYLKFIGKHKESEDPILINIFDLDGKNLYNLSLKSNLLHTENILENLQPLEKGIYIIKSTYNNTDEFEKLIVE